MQITLYASWTQSLKEKRMVIKSIIAKISNHFKVSVAEIDAQDVHKTIVIGIAAIVDSNKRADQLEEAILNYVEMNTEAEIIDSVSEIR